MATSVTIAPSLGHAPLFTQAGVGASPGYDAIDLRRISEAAGSQAGVFDTLGWKVTQRGAGANMTVDVAASTGLAVVGGTSVTAQSRYVIPPHSAVANLDIGANATGNPRIDQVVLQVRDTTHDGSGSNDVRVLVLAGTATSGATLDNRTGAASLPVSAVRLADILVANGAASITDAVIRDRRLWARGAMFTYARTAGDYTLSSTSYADLDATNLKPRIELSGVPLIVTISGLAASAVAQLNVFLALSLNAAAEVAERLTELAVITASTRWGAPLNYTGIIAAPSAGSTTVAVRAKLSAASSTTVYGSSGSQFHCLIREDPRSGHYNS